MQKNRAGGYRSAGRHFAFAGGPHRADDVVARAARLAKKCRQQGSPVVMVRVGWSADFAEALKQPVDAQAGAHTLPENWWTYPLALGKQESDIEVTKRQWGAFYGTDLELQLAVAVSTPLSCAASPPTSASNPPRATPGSWALIWSSPKMPAAPLRLNSIRAA
jgi:hypothetical protein